MQPRHKVLKSAAKIIIDSLIVFYVKNYLKLAFCVYKGYNLDILTKSVICCLVGQIMIKFGIEKKRY